MRRPSEAPGGQRCLAAALVLAACMAGMVQTTAAQDGLTLDPLHAQPAQSVRVVGVPAEPASPSLTGRFKDLEGEDGEPFPLLTRRTRSGELTFLVPLPPETDESTTLIVQLEEGATPPDPLELKIEPLEPASGATLALPRLARNTLAIEAERAGVSPEELDTRLQQAPETIPPHLLPTALARAFTTQVENRLQELLENELPDDFSPKQLDALIAAWGFVDMLHARRKRAEALAPAPVESPGTDTADNQADLFHWLVPPAHATVVTKPWQQLEIDTASELHYWMTARLEYLKGMPPESKERKTLPEEIRKDLADTGKSSAKEFAEGYFKEEKKKITESVEKSTGELLLGDAEKFKRYKKFFGKVLGAASLAKAVIDTTIYFNDRMRIALLPSTLVKLDLQLQPPVFTEEDDIRGTPKHSKFGAIDAQLDARSGHFEFTLTDAIRVATIGFAAVDQTKPDPKPGSDIPSLSLDVKDTRKLLKRLADKTDTIREQAHERRNEELSDTGVLWTVDPFEWRVYQVEKPKYSILTLIPSGKAAVNIFPFPTQYNPVRWGYRPLNAGTSTLRLRTAADKFPGAVPIATEAPVEVKAIEVEVRPDNLDMRPGTSEDFACLLSNVDQDYRKWRKKKGKLDEICRNDPACPTAKWTAPKLEAGKCQIKTALSCEAVTTQGIRADHDPPRVGSATIRVRRAGPLVVLPESSRVTPGQPVELEAKDSEQPVKWRLVEGDGKLESTGPYSARFVANTATRAVVEAYVPGEGKGCRPTALIEVGSCRAKEQGDFDGSMTGSQAKTFTREQRNNFAKLFMGGTRQPPSLQISTKRNGQWHFDISASLPNRPVAAGTTWQITDAGATGILAKEIGGGFHDLTGYPDHDTEDSWHEGSATVHIEQIEWADAPERTLRKGWACGTLQAQFNALRTRPKPPPQVRTAYTVQLNFTAEITRRAGTDWTPNLKDKDSNADENENAKSEFDKETERMAEELGL